MTTFSIYNLEHATIEDFMTVEVPMIDEEINDAIQYAVDYTAEQAESELQEMLNNASYPRYGYTTAEKFENEEEYEAWLREVMEEEAHDYRAGLFDMVKAESNKIQDELALNSVMTTNEVAEEFGIDDSTVRKAISGGRITSRQSGSTHLVLRKDAEKLWKRKVVLTDKEFDKRMDQHAKDNPLPKSDA